MDLYQVSDVARQDASDMLLVTGVTLGLRSLDAILIVGILRSGGDTRYAAVLDVGGIWFAGIPAVALALYCVPRRARRFRCARLRAAAGHLSPASVAPDFPG